MFNEKEFEIVKERALENHVPIIMDDTLEVIREILEKENPKRILEIGTAVGYSASCFVKYAKDAIVDTIELDEVRAQEAIENVKKIGVDNNINIMVGNAVDILPTLNGEYDLVFIDAAKSKYSIFLSEGIRLIRNGGIILADNVLYKVVSSDKEVKYEVARLDKETMYLIKDYLASARRQQMLKDWNLYSEK